MKNILLLLTIVLLSSCNQKTKNMQKIDLSNELQNKQIKVINRTISLFGEMGDAVEMDSQDHEGIGVLSEVEFSEGIIEVELLGENNPQKSFIGIAFNIQDENTYEAIYFRPFNFVAKEQIRKEHMVQYMCHPEYPWKKLRSEKTGEFEKELSIPPNPNEWFKVTIEINANNVKVFVNESEKSDLTIARLNTSKSNKIGLWTGFGSSGRFRNLSIKNK